MIRSVIAVIVGLVAAIIIFVIFETINHSIFQRPSGLENDAAMNQFMRDVPLKFMLLVIVGWAVGSFASGFIIRKISNSVSSILPIVAGAILTLSGIANLVLVTHPLWMQVVTVVIFVPFVWLGFSLPTRTAKT